MYRKLSSMIWVCCFLLCSNQVQAILVTDRWQEDLNSMTGFGQNDATQLLAVGPENYGEDNLVSHPSPDGFAVVNQFPDPGCPAGTCWFDKIFMVEPDDPLGTWQFNFVVINTSPFVWSDYHFEFYDATFTTQIGGILVDAVDNLIFANQDIMLNPDKVRYSGGDQQTGVTNRFSLLVNLETAPAQFGIRQIATVPEPTTLALLSLGLAGLGFRRRTMKA